MATGTDTGAATLLQPSDIAQAVLRTIAKPGFEVTVPGHIGPLARLINVLPRPLRELIMRSLVPNQVSQADRSAPESYEAQFGTER